ncbi:YkvA family protein [Thalassospira tepidiphila]|uniref:YkvA family protein n=1 Tax=Thalassospira tepidiphila TaxID=393657 RepID=UPI003AA803B4
MKKASVWMIVPNLLRTLMRKDVALKSKLLLLTGLVYLVSPVDFLPDVLVGIGWLDDLVIVPLLGWLSYRNLPDDVQREVIQDDPEKQSGSRRLFVYLGILAIVVIAVAVMGGMDTSLEPASIPAAD